MERHFLYFQEACLPIARPGPWAKAQGHFWCPKRGPRWLLTHSRSVRIRSASGLFDKFQLRSDVKTLPRKKAPFKNLGGFEDQANDGPW